MKKLIILVIVLIMVVVNFSMVLAAPWNNPNGSWLEVDCPEYSPVPVNVWLINGNSKASFDESGQIGITMSVYIDFGEGLELVSQVPGQGVYKKTVWCNWVADGLPMAGEVLIP